jgi:predicted Zn-dependent peptidase
VQLPCNPQKTEVLIDAFNAEVRQLQQNGPLPGDLQKIKKQWAEQDKISLTQNDVWLDHLMASYFPGANRDRFLHFEQYLNAITPQQIKEAARLLLPGKNQVTAILQPASPQ